MHTIGSSIRKGIALVSLSLSLFTGIACFNIAHSQPAPIPAQEQPTRVYRAQGFSEDTETLAVQTPSTVKQGEVLKISITSGAATCKFAAMAGQKAFFFDQPDSTSLALIPVSVFAKPGVEKLSIYDASNKLLKSVDITIQDGRYRVQNVNVSKSTAGLQPLPGELEAIQGLKDMISVTRYWELPFVSPTIDCQNSPFGVKRYHNGKPTGDYHKGLDLRSPAGRPIRAITDGKVQIARMYRLHGGTVGLDHGQGIGSIYIHMSKIAVQPGQMVKKGQTIGYVGSTGFATGPHLHWGLYVSGLPVNPNQWIPNVPTCK